MLLSWEEAVGPLPSKATRDAAWLACLGTAVAALPMPASATPAQ